MSRQRPCATGTRARAPGSALTLRGTRAAWYGSPRSAHLRPVRLFLLPVAYQAWMACPRPRRLGADLGDVLGPKTGVFRLGTSGSDVRRVPASRLAIHKLALVFKTFETFETFHVRHVAWLRGRRPVPDNLGLNLSTDLRFFRQNDVWWGGRRLGGRDGLILDQIYRVDCWIWARMSMDF